MISTLVYVFAVLLFYAIFATLLGLAKHFAANEWKGHCNDWRKSYDELQESHAIASRNIVGLQNDNARHANEAAALKDQLRAEQENFAVWKKARDGWMDNCYQVGDKLATERAISAELQATVERQRDAIIDLVEIIRASRDVAAGHAAALDVDLAAYETDDEEVLA